MELPGGGRVLRVYLVFYQVPSGRFSDSNNVRIRGGRGLSQRENCNGGQKSQVPRQKMMTDTSSHFD